jgi:hypothetical protein
MNEQKKYIIAHIQIPMEVAMNGKYTALSEHLSMEFKQCTNFDEFIQNTAEHSKANSNENFKKMIELLFAKMEEKEENVEENEPVKEQITLCIRPDEIINNKRRGQNASFKRYKVNSRNFTAKSWV